MPTRRFLPSVAVCALFACLLWTAHDASAGDYDFESYTVRKSAWEGHGVGSVVHRRTTQNMKMPQMPGGGRKMVTEVKETLKAITDTHYVIQVETTGMMGKQVTESREPKVVRINVERAKVKDAGEEKITIGGTEYTCLKKTVGDMTAFMDGMGGGMQGPGGQKMPVGSGTIWVHAKHGVLKTSTTMSMMGQQMTITMEATKLNVTRKVGDKDYACREWTLDLGGMGGKRVMLDAAAIPGGTVEGSMSINNQGFSMESKEELVAYVKKPLTATTPSAKPEAKPAPKAPAKAGK